MSNLEIHTGELFDTLFRWDIEGVLVDLTGYTAELHLGDCCESVQVLPVSIVSELVDGVEYNLSVSEVITLPKGLYDMQLQLTNPSSNKEVFSLGVLEVKCTMSVPDA